MRATSKPRTSAEVLEPQTYAEACELPGHMQLSQKDPELLLKPARPGDVKILSDDEIWTVFVKEKVRALREELPQVAVVEAVLAKEVEEAPEQVEEAELEVEEAEKSLGA
ncbi:hypothetical protein NDU88_001321 [Pleurodeles waltl]|uniref:Uncharacterized protein n=1 Tax=Pleurodeles waltl TaxID=8319 RepID=A0AAV7SC99_PLEWA|nr:hypothetical protein NDU88_001321 [Pleurodeles waltl]